ncbi:MAG: AEC family transporter [Pseudobutyrivibrio ruminis]|uniref:AEC family transporter n=1 Tax=Pseudobutyrivibrio ruminis TaxID=46206 RepID=UPI0026ED474B|nr:AEC family transporter [Pseudobutyrivibrio ruminis]MBE5912690.1 AEC family transporter [Pseudobutyrivibrio ruminis]
MISILLAKKIAEFFIFIILGFLIVRCNILKSTDSEVVTKLCIYLMTPAIIINAFQIDATGNVIKGLLLAVFNAVIIHIVCIIIAKLYGRLTNATEVERASIIYSNGGNLIVPIVGSVLGDEWVVYSAAFVAVFNIFVWTHGRGMFAKEDGIPWKKILLNVNIISIGVGLFMLVFDYKFTGLASSVIASLADMVGPVSMIIVGMVLGGMKVQNIFSNNRIWGVICMRLIICPLVILLIMSLLPVESFVPGGDTVMLVSFLAACAPCAATINQFAILYSKNAEYASAINILSTLLCILTMPIMVYLFQINH